MHFALSSMAAFSENEWERRDLFGSLPSIIKAAAAVAMTSGFLDLLRLAPPLDTGSVKKKWTR